MADDNSYQANQDVIAGARAIRSNPVDSDAKCNPVDSIGSSTKSRVSHSERLLLGFQGTKTARRGGISSPFSDAGGCTSPQNSGPAALAQLVALLNPPPRADPAGALATHSGPNMSDAMTESAMMPGGGPLGASSVRAPMPPVRPANLGAPTALPPGAVDPSIAANGSAIANVPPAVGAHAAARNGEATLQYARMETMARRRPGRQEATTTGRSSRIIRLFQLMQECQDAAPQRRSAS
jgi:hypothetical protein